MRLNSSDIEVKLNKDLRLEEGLYMNCCTEGDVQRRSERGGHGATGIKRKGQ